MFVDGDKGLAKPGFDSRLLSTTKVRLLRDVLPPAPLSLGLARLSGCHASIVPCNANLPEALRGDDPPETLGEDNLKTMKLIFTAYDSARSEKAVQFSHERNASAAG